MIDLEAARYRWHPVASSTDLVPRHVFQAQLLGREMALWRADDGNVNAWENRCLHRGVRLSIGINDGRELVCQYHGWRYANRTAGCTYIPAHPADAPARTICNNTYPAVEKHGLIWSGEKPDGQIPSLDVLDTTSITPLRGVTINVPLENIALPLIDHYSSGQRGASGDSVVHYGADTPDPFLLILHAHGHLHTSANAQAVDTPTPDIAFFFQPLDAARTAVRGVLCGVDEHNIGSAALIALLKQHSFMLCRARDIIESGHRDKPVPTPWTPYIPKVSDRHASMPPLTSAGQQAKLRVRLSAIENLSPSVKTFRFQALNTQIESAAPSVLPVAQPGAHIDIHLPNGLVRQYSLINGPGQTDHYAIAVKRLDDSTGGSHALHDSLKVGDVLATSVPRNNFTLRRDAEHTHLIAGGIGLTPLLSMARALDHSNLPFTLHHFIATETDAINRAELENMSAAVHWHVGQDVQQTQDTLSALLDAPTEHHHVYICGPGAMLGFTRETAATRGWADESIHFEYFKNPDVVDDSSEFNVELARSGLSLQVPAGKSLLSVLREHNVGVQSSCEQGACGTCRVEVLEGEPDHQDVYLSDTEKAQGNCLMSCVSRARSKRLVLDL